jgi:hypothetical protein
MVAMYATQADDNVRQCSLRLAKEAFLSGTPYDLLRLQNTSDEGGIFK